MKNKHIIKLKRLYVYVYNYYKSRVVTTYANMINLSVFYPKLSSLPYFSIERNKQVYLYINYYL